MKLLAALCFSLCVSSALAAQESQPLQRGSYQKIIKAHAGHPFIVALWSISCTHCGADLEILSRLSRKYAGFSLVLISTDSPEQGAAIEHTLGRYQLAQADAKQKGRGRVESWVFADSYTERLRFEIDAQWYGELPRTYYFDGSGNARGVSGVLDEKETEQWVISTQ